MNNSIVFIVPYYGKFPNYFREWLFSAGCLSKDEIDFLLVTDIEIPFDVPDNFRILNLSFEEFKNKVQAKFDFPIGLTTPYKLCDFKPTLGYIFEEEIKRYAFWGNCDIDQIWGNVRKFLPDDILGKYDRFQFLGHFILYKNTFDNNRMFMLPGAIYDYKTVLSDTMHYSFCEHSGMMRIVVRNKIKNFLKINYADLSPRYSRMFISRQDNYDYQILYWENGNVIRAYVDKDGLVSKDEYMYFHFQRKHPKSLQCWNENRVPKRIIYHADEFIEANEEEVTVDYIKRFADYRGPQIDKNENKQYKKKKIIDFLKSSPKKKILWIKQRFATREVISYEDYFGKNYSNI